jgi:DNA-binding NarL/FixJ family response regulator
MTTSVFIAQSNYLVKEGLKSLIFNEKGLSYSGETLILSDLISEVREKQPDVIIIDHADSAFGLSAVRKLRATFPKMGILTISDLPTKWMLSDVLGAGVNSYLLRDCEREEIVEAIEATAKGEQFFCGKVLSDVLKTSDEVNAESDLISCDGLKISQREADIIRLVAQGLTNKEIADKLFLSAHTVTTHRKNIMAKLGVNNTAGLVMFAIKNQIISPNHFLFNSN